MLQKAAFRKPWLYLPALGTELAAPLLRTYARTRTGPPSPPSSWRRGLLLGETHIGDVLYNTASLSFLKQGLPKCEWFYLAENPAAEVLQTNPYLAGVISRARPRIRCTKDRNTLQLLRAQAFDVAVCYNCGMYGRDLSLAIRLGIPSRVGYVHKGFSGWVTHPVPFSHRQPYPAHFRQLVGHLTGQAPGWDLRPAVFPGLQDRHMAAEAWANFFRNTDRPVLACFVSTRQPSGSWPVEFFGQTLRQLAGHVRVVLCGSAADRPLLDDLREKFLPDAAVLAGSLSLRALVCFLEKCRACLCPDSGPRHLANAANIPVFFFRNLWPNREETGSYLPTEVDLCPPAEHLSRAAQAEIMRGISPDEVIQKIQRIL